MLNAFGFLITIFQMKKLYILIQIKKGRSAPVCVIASAVTSCRSDNAFAIEKKTRSAPPTVSN